MDPYAAVVTTGIYCRPGCGARPRTDNVVPYPIAAAAEAAGYRACLRCRPYRQQPRAPAGAPDLVCRAVQRILDGALDGGTEATLADEFAVSARHLRRRFIEHLGVTPDGLARSARTHFARRLLDDTDWPVTQVAYAAGFGSVRQLNRSCLEIFRQPPNELRARRRRTDRLTADGGILLRLPFTGPLDWDALLAGLAAHVTPGVEYVAGRWYRRTIVVQEHPGVLELGPGGADHLLLRLHLPRWHELLHLVGRARRIANLDLHLVAAVNHLPADPQPTPLVSHRSGLRPPGCWDPFEAGVRAILDESSPPPQAQRCAAELAARLGSPAPGLTQLGLTHLFPSARTLATAAPAELRLPPAAAEQVATFSRAVATGELQLTRAQPLPELLTALTGTGGLPAPTAAILAGRLGEPAADLDTHHRRRNSARDRA